jgi:hypothetical protein
MQNSNLEVNDDYDKEFFLLIMGRMTFFKFRN